MKTELEQIEKMSPAKLFKPKFMPTLLKAIEIEATAEIHDPDTSDGRKAITSLAYKVARSKTTIDDLGKSFVAEQKSAIAAVDSVRKVARDFLDQLKVTVRAPLTAWEDAEESRIEKINIQLMHINALSALTNESPGREGERFSSEVLAKSLKLLKDLKITKRFAEYQDEAISLKNAGIIAIMDAIPLAEAVEHEAREDERRRLEEEETIRIEEEQRIARDAVNQADLESTRKLEEIERNTARETAEQQAREKDVKHRRAINNSIMEIFVDLGADRDLAKKIIQHIAKGKIPSVSVNY